MPFPPTLVFLSTADFDRLGAVIDNLLEHLAPDHHGLILFAINRKDVASPLLIADPTPLTARLIADDSLPFALTLITNARPDSAMVVSQHKPSLSVEISTEVLHLAWPAGVISLSQVANLRPFR